MREYRRLPRTGDRYGQLGRRLCHLPYGGAPVLSPFACLGFPSAEVGIRESDERAPLFPAHMRLPGSGSLRRPASLSRRSTTLSPSREGRLGVSARRKTIDSTRAFDFDSVVDSEVSALPLQSEESPAGKPASLSLQRTNHRKGRPLAVVRVHAQAFLDEVRAGTAERLTREALFAQMAEVVFSYWATKLGHPLAWLDPAREKRIMARLREADGDWGLLLYAVDGALRDDYLMGRDPRARRRYDGVETIFRDRAQIERLAEAMPRCVAGQPHRLVEKYQAGQ